MSKECCQITVSREEDGLVIRVKGKGIDGECCCTREESREKKRESDCCR